MKDVEQTKYCLTNSSLTMLQVDLSVNILDIHAIESKKPEQASLKNVLCSSMLSLSKS